MNTSFTDHRKCSVELLRNCKTQKNKRPREIWRRWKCSQECPGRRCNLKKIACKDKVSQSVIRNSEKVIHEHRISWKDLPIRNVSRPCCAQRNVLFKFYLAAQDRYPEHHFSWKTDIEIEYINGILIENTNIENKTIIFRLEKNIYTILNLVYIMDCKLSDTNGY